MGFHNGKPNVGSYRQTQYVTSYWPAQDGIHTIKPNMGHGDDDADDDVNL